MRDVETKAVGNNTMLASFTLAVDRRFKSKTEGQPTADFIPVSAWRKTVEFAQKYFCKGKQVYVSGSLETYSYEKDGEKRYSFKVNADEVGFADSARNDTNTVQNMNTMQNTNAVNSVPFSSGTDFGRDFPMPDFQGNEFMFPGAGIAGEGFMG